MKRCAFLLLFIFLSLILCNCSNDDNSNNNNNTGNMVTAGLSTDGWSLDYKSNSVIFTKMNLNEGVQRNLTAIMTSVTDTYSLILSVNDTGKGPITFKLGAFLDEGQAAFSKNSLQDFTYNTQLSGEITLTTMTDTEWVGSFHFEATCMSTSKVLKVITGKINAKQ